MDDYDKKTHTIKIKDIIFEILTVRLLTEGGEKLMRVKMKMGGAAGSSTGAAGPRRRGMETEDKATQRAARCTPKTPLPRTFF